ncbi:MAG: hypothetical protein BYD32DRAFT_8610 [Podila humilis]|nr:MAG: hypothetical protein BYD32DRAFT_8610 [Podila humilis]
MAEQDAHHHTSSSGSVAKLAPEIILHILSFLEYRDRPSRLLPILTLNKLWARLALVLLYEQPVLTVAQCTLLARTLQLKDRIDGKVLWDPSLSPDKVSDTEYHLNIDYTRLIKRPCRIIGPIAPTKHDLIQIWEIQYRLWESPAFKQVQTSEPSSPISLPSPPLSPPLPSDSRPSSRPSSPSPNKVVMVRRKKKQELPGPTVMLLEQPCVMIDKTEAVLGQVPGLKLSQLHVQWLLCSPIANLIKSNISTLDTFSIIKSTMRTATLLELAQAFGDRPESDKGRQGLKSLKLEDCKTINRTVLSAFVQSCASTLEVFEIREAPMIRPDGDHSIFPLDGPGNWNPESPAPTDTQHDHPRLGLEEYCIQCGTRGKDQNQDPSQEGDVENHIESLAIAAEPSPLTPNPQVGQNPALPQALTAADQHPETRTDLALLEFAENCHRLQVVRLHRMTWLSDQVLAGFRPSLEAGEQRGLRAIELIDSYYGSSVTIEGMLEICGPRLESLTLDRKSCWRVKPNTADQPSPLCSECYIREANIRTIEKNRTTGDRILWGLLQKEHGFRRLKKLTLMDHWVTVLVLKDVVQRWSLHLVTLDLKICKCPFETLLDALIPVELKPAPSTIPSKLEHLSLALPWVPEDDTKNIPTIARQLFASHPRLESVQVNRQKWTRNSMAQ